MYSELTSILKEFQVDVINENLTLLRDVYVNGNTFDARRVTVSPTGSGKTLMMSAIIQTGLKLYPKSSFVWITHNKQISKQTTEGLHSEIVPYICTVDDIEAGINSAARVLLFNVQKGLSKNANVWLKHWIKRQEDNNRKCIFIVDEADEGQSGLNMKSLRKILKPKLELGFTASFKSGIGDILFHRVEYNQVVKAGLIVDNIYYEVSSEVAMREMIKKAIDKRNRLEGLTNILRGTNSFFIPKMAIQTKASDAEDMKILLLELLNLDIKSAKEQVKIHIQNNRELDNANMSEVRYIIGDLMIERGWDLPELSVLVATKQSLSVAKGVQLLGRVMRLAKGKRLQEEELEPLNAGYVYVSGKHSIQKSCEEFMAQGFTTPGDDPLGIEIETVKRREGIVLPEIETTKGELLHDVWSDKLDFVVDNSIEEIFSLLEGINESNPTVRKGSLGLVKLNHNPASIEHIKAEWDYEHTKDVIRNALLVHFHRALCELIVGQFHSEVLLRSLNIGELSGKLKEVAKNIRKSDYFSRLSLDIEIKRQLFVWPETINVKKRKNNSHSRNIFPKISGLNSEEVDFAINLDQACKDNGWYWFRNTPSDIMVAKSGYPDFVVFSRNKYVFIEYKGFHLAKSDNSNLKNAMGRLGRGNYYMVFKKDIDDENYYSKGVTGNTEEMFNFTNHLRIYLR